MDLAAERDDDGHRRPGLSDPGGTEAHLIGARRLCSIQPRYRS
jgi:hypothetical protein